MYRMNAVPKPPPAIKIFRVVREPPGVIVAFLEYAVVVA